MWTDADVDHRVARLEQRLNDLEGKLRPGSRFVTDLHFKQVLSESFSLPAGITTRGPFDISPDLELATYVLSAKVTTADNDTMIYAGVDAISGTDVFAAVVRVFKAGPVDRRLETLIQWFNATGQPKTVTIKVWRILGLF